MLLFRRTQFTYFHTFIRRNWKNSFTQTAPIYTFQTLTPNRGFPLVKTPFVNPRILLDNYATKGVKIVSITFIDRDGDTIKVSAKVGDTLLDVAKENDIDLEGACGGTLACSTCHLIFDKVVFDTLPEEATDEELDMLEMAYQLTDTSRLGCQVDVTEEMDGIVLKVPTQTMDARNL